MPPIRAAKTSYLAAFLLGVLIAVLCTSRGHSAEVIMTAAQFFAA